MFAAAYSFGPWDTARLTVEQYDQLLGAATDVLKLKSGLIGGDE